MQQSYIAAWSAPSVPQYGISQMFNMNSATSTGLPQTLTFNGATGNVISQPMSNSGTNSTGLPQTLMLNGAAATRFVPQPFSMTHSANAVPPTLSPNGVDNIGGMSLAMNNASSFVQSGSSQPLPTVYPLTLLQTADGSVPLGKLIAVMCQLTVV